MQRIEFRLAVGFCEGVAFRAAVRSSCVELVRPCQILARFHQSAVLARTMDIHTSNLLVHDADILTFARSGKAERERMISRDKPEQVPDTLLTKYSLQTIGIRTAEQTDGLHGLAAEHIAEGADSRRVVSAISCDRVAESHASEDAQQTEDE